MQMFIYSSDFSNNFDSAMKINEPIFKQLQ